MDPASAIGTASAVLAFAQITTQGVQLATELVRRMREPPKFIKATLEALQLLQDIEQDISASTVKQGQDAGKNIIKACERCSVCVNELLATLQKLEQSPQDGKMAKAKNAYDTLRYEQDIKDQLQALGYKKQDLLLALVSPSTVAGTIKATLTPAINELFATDTFLHNLNAPASDIPSDQAGVNKFLRELCVEKPQDIRQRLIKAKGNRVDGTCSWVLEHEAYQSWLAGTEQGLWINGDPGKGKTMTSIFLTQELERHAVKSDGVLLYFFCDSQFEKQRTRLGFIQSLTHQLCLARPPLAFHCLTEYQQHGSIVSLWCERCCQPITAFVILDNCEAEDRFHSGPEASVEPS